MPRLRLDLDNETYQHLLRISDSERRPIVLQAEVLIRKGLGLPFPVPVANDSDIHFEHHGNASPVPGLGEGQR